MNRATIDYCAEKLAEKGLTIAFAESATAGRMAYEFSLAAKSGEVLKGGLVCYDAQLKEKILNVPAHLIEEFTPESPEVTLAITEGLVGLIDASIYIGVTGLTTPGGSETPEKPVGTFFYCALFGEFCIFKERAVFKGSPDEIVEQAVEQLAVYLRNYLDLE